MLSFPTGYPSLVRTCRAVGTAGREGEVAGHGGDEAGLGLARLDRPRRLGLGALVIVAARARVAPLERVVHPLRHA